MSNPLFLPLPCLVQSSTPSSPPTALCAAPANPRTGPDLPQTGATFGPRGLWGPTGLAAWQAKGRGNGKAETGRGRQAKDSYKSSCVSCRVCSDTCMHLPPAQAAVLSHVPFPSSFHFTLLLDSTCIDGGGRTKRQRHHQRPCPRQRLTRPARSSSKSRQMGLWVVARAATRS